MGKIQEPIVCFILKLIFQEKYAIENICHKNPLLVMKLTLYLELEYMMKIYPKEEASNGS